MADPGARSDRSLDPDSGSADCAVPRPGALSGPIPTHCRSSPSDPLMDDRAHSPRPKKHARKKKGSRALVRRSTNVPGQYRGFSLQADRFLHHLLSGHPGVSVSLEVIGDTGVDYPDGKRRTEEAKSRTARGNPVRDRSPDLWKTLRNWVEAAEAGRLDPTTTQFRLYVPRPFEGRLVHQFHDATTEHQALRALKAAYEVMGITSSRRTGEPLRLPRGLPKSLREHLEVVLRAPSRLVATIIANFRLEVGSGHAIEDLEASIDATFIPPEIAADVLHHVTGWLKARIDDQIDRGEAVCVRWEDFRAAVNTAVRLLDRLDVLKSLARAPRDDEVQAHLQFRTYVKQLGLIEVDFDEQLRAVTEFVQAETNRTMWAEQGRVVEESFAEFEQALINSWRTSKRRGDILHKARLATERGQLLYADCCAYQTKLGGAEPPEGFCRGSFHKLADGPVDGTVDGPVIGWHPSYRDLLADEKPNEQRSRSVRATSSRASNKAGDDTA